ncbi:hypothetical protein ASD54_08830 [Rhizobium sp. Root149]|uniref:nucleotidyl transferase AbiEii/AbiGii toxin family protein n=1 Tax=Rhizobium sp. Root149 TaxID=1736473 RepID=UPI000714360D|nr:nucleotidyl transferase AbiEii/AbiGii toxin family protein [Rhizobium sp. Root149]KQZ50348.1 hypothetical protein ASD54_08830 [Rhizobium sp. Root149]
MAHFTISDAALGDKLKQASRAYGLDTTKTATAHAAKSVLQALKPHLPPYVVVGGLAFDAKLRETEDADIVAIRHVSNREIQTAFKTIAPRLALQGINIKDLSREPREMPMEYGESVNRWRVQATTGGIRTNFDLDIGCANGPLARTTEPTVSRRIPSLIKGLPDFHGYIQPKSTSAAQKLLAVLMQPASDLRVKHLADLVHTELWPAELNCDVVAKEVARVCAQRGIPMSVCQEDPEALRWIVMARLEANWEKDGAARRTGKTMFQAWTDIGIIWSNVYEELRNNVIREVRRPDYRPRLLEKIIETPRHEVPAYKPRF